MKNYFLILLVLFFSLNLFSQNKQVEKITIAPGPEDFVLVNNRLIISCAERRTENEFQGGFWSLNLDNNKLDQFDITLLKKRKLSPHGISFFKEGRNEYLFVVNHYSKSESEIICFRIEQNKLIEIKSFRDKTIKKPNAVVAVSLDEFFITNSIPFTGNVVYYNNKNYKVISKGLSYANGILMLDNKLYVAPTLGNKLLLLELAENNKFKRTKIAKLKGPDNIRPDNNGNLLIVGHTNISKFLAHVKNKNKKSPFIVYSVNLKNKNTEILYENDGSILSGGSTAVIYKEYLYVAQVFENFILKIKL